MEELASLAELATAPPFEVGTRVLVHEDGYVYISVGNTRPEIRDRLGWTQGNVWMPDHVEGRLLVQHPEIQPSVDAMAHVLSHPIRVGLRRGKAGEPSVQFIIGGDELRTLGYLRSRSTLYVDVLVELRQMQDEVILRGYHISPMNRIPGRRPIWP